jgi:hypothetical protein
LRLCVTFDRPEAKFEVIRTGDDGREAHPAPAPPLPLLVLGGPLRTVPVPEAIEAPNAKATSCAITQAKNGDIGSFLRK